MPFYSFRNPDTGEVRDILMSMDDEHKFADDSGLEWERVFSLPQACIDTRIDPFNRNKFVEKTAKAGTMGELWDRSQDLSLQREQKRGVDDVKKKFFENYSKERRGRMHPAERAEKNKGEIVV